MANVFAPTTRHDCSMQAVKELGMVARQALKRPAILRTRAHDEAAEDAVYTLRIIAENRIEIGGSRGNQAQGEENGAGPQAAGRSSFGVRPAGPAQ